MRASREREKPRKPRFLPCNSGPNSRELTSPPARWMAPLAERAASTRPQLASRVHASSEEENLHPPPLPPSGPVWPKGKGNPWTTRRPLRFFRPEPERLSQPFPGQSRQAGAGGRQAGSGERAPRICGRTWAPRAGAEKKSRAGSALRRGTVAGSPVLPGGEQPGLPRGRKREPRSGTKAAGGSGGLFSRQPGGRAPSSVLPAPLPSSALLPTPPPQRRPRRRHPRGPRRPPKGPRAAAESGRGGRRGGSQLRLYL